jgi:hypothetical protein
MKQIMDWMITQIFLSETGVHEVEVHGRTMSLRCNCPGFDKRGACKHTYHVRHAMEENGGIYPTQISDRISREDSLEAAQDPKAFRNLLVNYGKILVV